MIFHHICAVRQHPEPEIVEIDVPEHEALSVTARLLRRGFETVFTSKTFHGNLRPRKAKQ